MPLHEPSPYEVLGVAGDAGVREINLAVGPAVRAGRFTRQQINEAAALLRNPARRLELDAQRVLAPDPVDSLAALLAPVLDQPLPDPPRDPLSARDLLAVHRAEIEAEYASPPPAPGQAPPPPARFAPDVSLLPPIEVPR
jgi:hypothetical protein